ncbi:hypothetical protein DENSPDRAFT_668646 [Dentipellis sp. KUC8613]|nr:hypothetical protein DENSPDRAFT_668646 [Dentipellis sp. KUC8613]
MASISSLGEFNAPLIIVFCAAQSYPHLAFPMQRTSAQHDVTGRYLVSAGCRSCFHSWKFLDSLYSPSPHALKRRLVCSHQGGRCLRASQPLGTLHSNRRVASCFFRRA